MVDMSTIDWGTVCFIGFIVFVIMIIAVAILLLRKKTVLKLPMTDIGILCHNVDEKIRREKPDCKINFNFKKRMFVIEKGMWRGIKLYFKQKENEILVKYGYTFPPSGFVIFFLCFLFFIPAAIALDVYVSIASTRFLKDEILPMLRVTQQGYVLPAQPKIPAPPTPTQQVKCYKCGHTMQVTSLKRPLEIICLKCGAKGMLR